MNEPPDSKWPDFLFWIALGGGIAAMGLTIGMAAAFMI
jgi:hypothetical protein